MEKAANKRFAGRFDQRTGSAPAGGPGPEKAMGANQAIAPIDRNLDRLSFILDKAIRIPGTNFRFGLDPIISLLFPVAGDTVAAMMSAYIVLVSVRYGLPKSVITRMVFNVAADYAVGSVPLLGDLFDFAWKSNDKNMRLLNKHAAGEGRSFWSDWLWVIVLLGLLGLMVFGAIALVVFAISRINIF